MSASRRRARSDVRLPLEALLGVPFTEGNHVQVLRNGAGTFPVLLDTIAAATRTVDLLWFVWGKGEVTRRVAGALSERARAGVRVRVLLDGFGGKGIERPLLAEMRAAGCEVFFFAPLRTWRVTALNLRTHRRALICDESVAITGGLGSDEAWTGDAQSPGHYRDTSVLVRGPAVDGLRSAFALDWLQVPQPLFGERDRYPVQPIAGDARVQVVRAASGLGWNESSLATLTLLQLARDRVRIATPFARLPQRFREALVATARRGVQVQLLVNGSHVDRRSVQLQGQRDYQALLDAGVEIWQYQPTYLHSIVALRT